MTTTTETTIVAERAAASVRELAQLTRPAITDLTTSDLYDLTGTLADLVAALPQVLNQLAAYPGAVAARDCLAHANHVAAQLAVVLDTAHQTLDNTVENITTQPEGVNFQPTERGQFSAAVDIQAAVAACPPSRQLPLVVSPLPPFCCLLLRA